MAGDEAFPRTAGKLFTNETCGLTSKEGESSVIPGEISRLLKESQFLNLNRHQLYPI